MSISGRCYRLAVNDDEEVTLDLIGMLMNLHKFLPVFCQLPSSHVQPSETRQVWLGFVTQKLFVLQKIFRLAGTFF